MTHLIETLGRKVPAHMSQPQSTSTQRIKKTIFGTLKGISVILVLYDVYLDLHDPYERLDVERLATLFFLIGVIPRGKLTSTFIPDGSLLAFWWPVIQIDCLLITIGLLSYALYYRLTV